MNRAAPSLGFFVTGTDTEIGKTCVSAALLHLFAKAGYRSAGLKPVAAGTELIAGERINEDVRALRGAGSLALTGAEVGPLQLDAACAPHIAAALEGRTIDRGAILRAARALAERADVLVVEGVGGFCVPLGADWDTSDLAVDLAMPVVLVVGLRLGCINHALLTAQAIRSRGLRLAGWIGNCVASDMPWTDENVATLRDWLCRLHGAPCLGVVPRLAQPDAPAVAAHLHGAILRALLTSSTSTVSS